MANKKTKYSKKAPIGNSLTRKLLIVLLFSVLVFAAAVWGVSAKYVKQSEGEGIVKAPEFYFTSDYLMPGGAEYVVNSNQMPLTIQLRNYDGLEVSELKVYYEVYNGSVMIADGEITSEKANTANITLNLEPGTYTITATGSNGYSKTLSATIIVRPPANNIFYNVRDFGDYVLVTVWTENATATNLTISGLEGFIPDETDEALTGKKTGDNVTHNANLGQFQSRSYRFFKDGGNAGAIVVTADGNAITKNTNLT